MAHKVAAYDLTCERPRTVRGETKGDKLVLSSELARLPDTLDLLNVLKSHTKDVEPIANSAKTYATRCIRIKQTGNSVALVLCRDTKGEREAFYNSETSEIDFISNHALHVSRTYSLVLITRETGAKSGSIVVHRPYGRGASKDTLTKLLNRAINRETSARAKTVISPRLREDQIIALLEKFGAARVVYGRDRSMSFSNVTSTTQMYARETLTVAGQAYEKQLKAFGKKLAKTIRKKGSKDFSEFYTIEVPALHDDDVAGAVVTEDFESVKVTTEGNGERAHFALEKSDAPTTIMDMTSEFQAVYTALASVTLDDDEKSGDRVEDALALEEKMVDQLLQQGIPLLKKAAKNFGWK